MFVVNQCGCEMTPGSKKFIPVMLTPFDNRGNIDFASLTNLTEYYISAGAKGLFANCLSSEMYALSPAERIEITHHVVRIANGRVPVVSTGSFDRKPLDMIEFVKRIHDTGVESVILATSMMASEEESDDVFERRFETLLNATGNIPFGFYECPLPYKRLVSPALLERLLVSRRVTYFKDTSLNIAQVATKARAGASYAFGLYDAYMVHAVESLKAGSAGLSCIQGNYFPELIVWLCNNYDNPSLQAEVGRVQEFLREHMEIMHKCYPSTAKRFLRQRGLDIGCHSRSQPKVITADDNRRLKHLLIEYFRLEEELLLCDIL